MLSMHVHSYMVDYTFTFLHGHIMLVVLVATSIETESI